jgi:Tol biopolymer transport system component
MSARRLLCPARPTQPTAPDHSALPPGFPDFDLRQLGPHGGTGRTERPLRRRLPRLLVSVVTLLLLLPACGTGDDDGGAGGTSPGPTPTAPLAPTTTVLPSSVPASGGLIVFAGTVDDQLQDGEFVPHRQDRIWQVRPDGFDLLGLTKGERSDSQPIWSPDGAMLAFVHEPAGMGGAEVWVMTVDDAERRRLEPRTASNATIQFSSIGSLSWSPDGARFLFAGMARTGTNGGWTSDTWRIYVMEADGSNLRDLSGGPGVDDVTPAWSPDGGRIAWSHAEGGAAMTRAIWVMAADGSGARNLSQVAGPEPDVLDIVPSWSPDGARILFSRLVWEAGQPTMALILADADTANLQTVADGSTMNTSASWSPDGERIVFARGEPARDGRRSIYVIDADGANPRALTPPDRRADYPAWSPDGQQIAYLAEAGIALEGSPQKSSEIAFHDIHVMDADGANDRVIVSKVMPVGSLSLNALQWRPGGATTPTRTGGNERQMLLADPVGDLSAGSTPTDLTVPGIDLTGVALNLTDAELRVTLIAADAIPAQPPNGELGWAMELRVGGSSAHRVTLRLRDNVWTLMTYDFANSAEEREAAPFIDGHRLTIVIPRTELAHLSVPFQWFAAAWWQRDPFAPPGDIGERVPNEEIATFTGDATSALPSFDSLPEAACPFGIDGAQLPASAGAVEALAARMSDEIVGYTRKDLVWTEQGSELTVVWGSDDQGLRLIVADVSAGHFYPAGSTVGDVIGLFATGYDWQVVSSGRKGDLGCVQWIGGPDDDLALPVRLAVGNRGSLWLFTFAASGDESLGALLDAFGAAASAPAE